MKRSYRWLYSVIVLSALYIPFLSRSQDIIKTKAVNQRVQSFDNFPTLYILKASLCGFYDYAPDRDSCIDERETATDKSDSNIIRHTIIRGREGKYVDTFIYYYIDKKICKIIVQKQMGEQLQYDSEIYLQDETVMSQNDRLGKLNATVYIQDAKAIIKP